MKMLSLFSGAGMIDLAASWAGKWLGIGERRKL